MNFLWAFQGWLYLFSVLEVGEEDLPDVPGFTPDEDFAADAADGVPALKAGGGFVPRVAGFSPMDCFAASAAGEDFSPPCFVSTLAGLFVWFFMDLMKDSSVWVEESTFNEAAFA